MENFVFPLVGGGLSRPHHIHNPAVFKAKMVGDFEVNGTRPVGLNSIGDAPGAR